jgi:hypothetical protein
VGKAGEAAVTLQHAASGFVEPSYSAAVVHSLRHDLLEAVLLPAQCVHLELVRFHFACKLLLQLYGELVKF